MRVLVTGAAGRIGSVVSERLAARHDLRGLDVVPWPEDGRPAYPGELVVGDVTDPTVAAAAVRDVDAVVHLAGIPHEAPLPDILHSHVVSTAALLDAMVQHGVRRMVYASSNHAIGMTPRPETGQVAADAPPRPDTFYGVGKVAAEALLSLYADRHGISSVALRIGNFRDEPENRRSLSVWLSYDDAAALVEAGLTADFSGVRTVFGISANRDAWWDLGAGRAIGYHPHDDASAFEGEIRSRPDDAEEAARVGGEYATDAFARRPFD